MPIINSGTRYQMQMICWEQYIEPDNPVRVVDAFVDYFDLPSLGFEQKGQCPEGRPSFETATLVKLYVYGYLNRVRSSRSLAKAAARNVELFWLLKEAKPRYRTIAEFRKQHCKALKQLFVAFVQFLKGEDLLDLDIVAIDGSKFRAQNSKKCNYNIRKVNQHLTNIAKQTANYLEELE